MGMSQGNTMDYLDGHEHEQMNSLTRGINAARSAFRRGDAADQKTAKEDFFKQG